MADEVEIGTAGELLLSPQMLEHMGVRPGEQVTLFMLPNGIVRVPKAMAARDQAAPGTVRSLGLRDGGAR